METVAPQQEIGLLGRMLRIFYAPSETFESVARQRNTADWLVPTFLGAITLLVAAVLTQPITQQVAMEAMQNMPPEQRQAMESSQGIIQTVGLVAAPIGAFIGIAIAALFYLVLGRLLGGNLNFGQALTIAAYSMLITIPQNLVKVPLILAKKTLAIQMGLGLLLSEEALQTFSGRLLATIDPFAVWGLIIVGLGLSIVGEIERNKAFIGAAVLSLFWLAIAAAMAGFGNPAG